MRAVVHLSERHSRLKSFWPTRAMKAGAEIELNRPISDLSICGRYGPGRAQSQSVWLENRRMANREIDRWEARH